MFATYANLNGVSEKCITNLETKGLAEHCAIFSVNAFTLRTEHTKRAVRWGNSWYTPSGEFIAGFVEESD